MRSHSSHAVNCGDFWLNLFSNPDDHKKLNQGDELVIENVHDAVKNKSDIAVKNKITGETITCSLNLKDREREILIHGGLLNYIKHKK